MRNKKILIGLMFLLIFVQLPLTSIAAASPIQDDALRKAINEELGKTGAEIDTYQPTQADLESISNLSAYRKNITNLAGLELATNLTNLNLSSNNISDISTLSSLTKLEYLIFSGNNITDITPLNSLNNLTTLYLDRNTNLDPNPLSSLTNMEALYLNSVQISDLEPIKNLTKLTLLTLADNNITDISKLSNLTNLENLNIDNNDVSSLSVISNFPKLTNLSLDNNTQIDQNDLSALDNFPNLERLSIAGLNLNSLSFITNLTKITELNFSGNNISDLTPLKNLNDLYYLFFSDNNVSDLSVLGDNNSLNRISFENNNVSTLQQIGNLTQLRGINLTGNSISDLSPISNFSYLYQLEASGNAISDLSPLKNVVDGLTSFEIEDQSITLQEVELHTNSTELEIINPIKDVVGNPVANITPSDSGTYNSPTISWTGLNSADTSRSFTFTMNIDNNTNFTGEAIQPINRVDNYTPVITATDKTITEGSNFNPITGVTATDEEDGDLTAAIEVESSNVNTNEPGDYSVTYKVTDSGQLSDVETITVTVTGKPFFRGAYTHTIDRSDSNTFDPLERVQAFDLEDGDITDDIEVIKNEVKVNVSGEYEVTYQVTDSDDNTTTKTIKIYVNVGPVINASDQTIYVGDSYDPMEYVTANDTENGDITDRIRVDKNEVNPNVPGEYEVSYSVYDNSEYSAVKTITVTVINRAPEIAASNQTLTVGDSFEPLEDVTATDAEDGDISDKIVVTTNNVNMNTAGEFDVTYDVTDSHGKTTTKTITVTVEPLPGEASEPEKEEDKPTKSGDQSEDDEDSLPQTGEATLWLFVLGGVLMLFIGFFTIRYNKNNK
ncbi:DUF5011 domain-containing protein [Aquibacillus halophilus]|uniref:DUF5011 domain-containing protein n=1 Tax=Aquibacillus halophilus TaxID=930132 RepID=A0A6A8DAH1_9BACI|nr:immunoglobulin-like domain-containing protein [Aquibacillus halophilus]MRH42743.1 DUF5011 domain-containing protein [Aquibacillus halophilus]